MRDAIAQSLDSGGLPLRRHRSGPGRVVLVGGGPGDADLLTLRARRELAAADVVVVDRLAPQAVLDELGPAVLILDVGKAPGRHPVPQHEINRLLVEHAQAGRRVVRLKGGDPFLLGRGAEEVAACRAAGIDVERRPRRDQRLRRTRRRRHPGDAPRDGPPGHRAVRARRDGRRRSTGRRSSPAGGTLVILMGVAALPRIAAELLAAGADRRPARSGDRERLDSGAAGGDRGRCPTIADAARRLRVAPPAVIVIGDVAAFAEDDAGGHGIGGQSERSAW